MSKRSIAAGIILSLAAICLVLRYSGDYLDVPGYGGLILGCALAAALLIFPAAAIRPDRNGKRYPLYVIVIFFLAPLVLAGVVELLNGNFLFSMPHAAWVDNYCIILLCQLLVFALCGSLRLSVFILAPVLFLFGLANMYIKEFRGTPFLPMDMGSIATAATVAGGYTYRIGMEVSLAAVIITLLIALVSRAAMPAGMSRKLKAALRSSCLALVILFSAFFYASDVFVNLGYKPDFFNQLRGYNNNGAVLSFVENTRYMKNEVPKGYDADELEEALNVSPDRGSGMKADIIVIMNESFADLRAVGDFTTDKEVMPFIDSLSEDTVKGYAYAPTFGSGTSNTEFEFLTGDPMAFFRTGSNAYQLYVKDKMPGLVSTLNDSGYETWAFHPYFKGNWNREQVYNLMGFDLYLGFEDIFSDEETEYYKQYSGNYFSFGKRLEESYGRQVLLRKYVSDSYDYHKVIDIYEDRDKEKPFFMFNITIQNHSPYNLLMERDADSVRITGLKGDYPQAEQYLTIIRKSDRAFKDLVDHFRNVERPTVILMFGDHQPFVEDEFYEEVMGAAPSDLSDEEQLKRYMTRFVLWANFDIEERDDVMLSTNYLANLVTKEAGLPQTEYAAFTEDLSVSVPVITPYGCLDSRGKYFSPEDDSIYAEELSLYSKLTYNNCLDSGNMVKSLFYLPEP